jgi:hypothetical protein
MPIKLDSLNSYDAAFLIVSANSKSLKVIKPLNITLPPRAYEGIWAVGLWNSLGIWSDTEVWGT